MIVDDVLDSAKTALKIDTDYQLAKRLGISTAYITRYRQHKQIPNLYVCTRLAEVFKVDPFALMVEIEAETETNADRRAFWEGKRKTASDCWPWNDWRARRDSNARPLPSEGSTLSS